MAIEVVRRLIENSSSDTEVQKDTDLSSVEISELRNWLLRTCGVFPSLKTSEVGQLIQQVK